MTATHALERTSPKGQKFFGRCIRCGMSNLEMKAALQRCENTNNLTDEQALLKAIEGP
jgi:hypothetical protein